MQFAVLKGFNPLSYFYSRVIKDGATITFGKEFQSPIVFLQSGHFIPTIHLMEEKVSIPYRISTVGSWTVGAAFMAAMAMFQSPIVFLQSGHPNKKMSKSIKMSRVSIPYRISTVGS